jgi:hypothetical protein
MPLKQEVRSNNKRLDELDAIPGVKHKRFVAGNHEYRLQRYLMTKAPELFGMFSIRSLLRLKERGWLYTPYMRHVKIGPINFTHEAGNAGPLAHIRARAAFEGNIVIGHTHRLAFQYQGNAQGEPHLGAMLGWLGDIEKIDYVHRVTALQWQLGFGLAYEDTETGLVHLQPTPILEAKGQYFCVVEGQRIAA